MTLRLSDYVVAGELINRRRNATHGWIALRDHDHPILIQLTGDPSSDLVGKRFRFELPLDRAPPTPAPPPLDFDKIAWQQIGPTGEMTIRPADGSADTATRLYLEWFSQNGRVVIELVDPVLEWVENDDEDRRQSGMAADETTAESSTDDIATGTAEVSLEGLPEDDEDDPYGLFPPGLDEEIADDDKVTTDGPPASPPPRDWSEVIPGIDEETKRMYEEWDEVTHGTRDVPLREIFDPPIKIYTAQQLATLADAEAAAELKELLKRLALLGVALAICEHYTPQMTYRYLAEEILPEYGVHPRLPQIGWVQHYDTSEDCPQCQAEFERRWEAEHSEHKRDDEASEDDTQG